MKEVIERYPDGGGKKLMLMVLANFASPTGDNIFPSNSTAAALACVSESQARRIKKELVAERILLKVGESRGGRASLESTQRYRIDLERLRALPPLAGKRCDTAGPETDTPRADATPSTSATPRMDATPSANARDPSHGCAAPLAPVRPNPLVTTNNHQGAAEIAADAAPPSGEHPRAKPKRGENAITFSTFLDRCKDSGEKPIPRTDPVFVYIREMRIPEDYLQLNWIEFKKRYTENRGRKRYTNWRQVFRNSIEENWFKLWVPDEGHGWKLTSMGIQAKRAHEARRNRDGGGDQAGAAHG